MKIQSLVRDQNQLIAVDVEVSFLPGLPTIQFLGLPDQVIKESIHRIKSAIRNEGFEFPKAQQVLVNIRPNHLKKSSRGLELAVAAAILWATDQIPRGSAESLLVYGELGLNGEVFEPEDLAKDYEGGESVSVLTGSGGLAQVPFMRSCISSLKQLQSPERLPATQRYFSCERPRQNLNLEFSKSQALLLELIALGEHSVLLAGPAGSGKSTLAKTISSLLAEPSQEDLRDIFKSLKAVGETPSWRPVVNPHHTTSPLGLIGGGVPPFPGEISRAHKGILILDELLEFHPKVQEALREPMEEGCIRLRRGRYTDEYPAESLVISTTNLCPCGDKVPQTRVICGRSLRKCQSYGERLSGPLVDRFQTVFFTKKREDGEKVSGTAILEKLEVTRAFRAEQALVDERFLKPAGRWTLEELARDLSSFYMENLFPQELGSRRRDLSTLRVARSFADMERQVRLTPDHVEQALKWTHLPFEALKRLGC
jgi:magnesium chelatase family protein